MKKTISKSGDKASTVKLYKYSEQLQFLKRFFDERKTKSNIKGAEQEDEDLEEIETQPEDEARDEDDIRMQDDAGYTNLSEVTSEDLADQSSPSTTRRPSPPKRLVTGKVVKNKVVPQQTASATLMEYLINKNKQATSSENPVDAFLAGIAPTLKNLTPYYLHLAKSEIFATVQKYEMKMLLMEHNPHQERFEPQSRHFAGSSYSTTPMQSPVEQNLHQETSAPHSGHCTGSSYSGTPRHSPAPQLQELTEATSLIEHDHSLHNRSLYNCDKYYTNNFN